MGAFTNGVVILAGGVLEEMTQDDGRRGCWAKDDVTFFNMISGEIFKRFDLQKLVLS